MDEMTVVWAKFAANLEAVVGRPVAVMGAIVILAGAVALLFGRRFAWLYAGLLGFMGGLLAAPFLIGPLPGGVVQTLVLSFGVVGALLGAAASGPLLLLMGALGLGGIGYFAAKSFALGAPLTWLLLGAGAVAGVIAMRARREWLLLLVSVFYGASAILIALRWTVSGLGLRTQALTFLALLAVGIIFQSVDYLRTRDQEVRIPRSAGGLGKRPWRRRGSRNNPPTTTA